MLVTCLKHAAHVLSFATHLDYADINMARVSLASHVASCHTCCSFLLLSVGYNAKQATKEVVGEASDILQVMIKSMLTTPVHTSHTHFVFLRVHILFAGPKKRDD